jgi:hypothetical protein
LCEPAYLGCALPQRHDHVRVNRGRHAREVLLTIG